jgi:hypothetical protein
VPAPVKKSTNETYGGYEEKNANGPEKLRDLRGSFRIDDREERRNEGDHPNGYG